MSQEEFETSCDTMKNKVRKTLNDDELKEVYALFKQATVGDVNIEKPGMMDLKASAKWEAWNSKKGMEQGIARKEYIEMVEKMKDKHGLI